MKLSITGNANFFLHPINNEDKISIETYYIDGVFTNNYNDSTANLKIKGIEESKTAAELFQISNNIKGKDFKEAGEILSEFELGDLNYWNSNLKTYQELGMIKSLFNLYLWFEPCFNKYYNNDDYNIIEANLYDSITVDYSGKIGTLADMYLLPKSYVNDKNFCKELDHLMNINLLCKISLTLNGTPHDSYFIPFTKPGIPQENFTFKNNNKELNAYSLWNSLLKLRDNKLRDTFNQL